MFATLISAGSGSASTQTACGRSARSIRLATIRCSSRFLALCRSCSPRWSSTAGSALRRVEPASATVAAPAPRRRIRSSGLAPRKAASGVPTQKQKHDGNDCAHRAEDGRRVVGGMGASTETSRARTTFSSAPARIRRTAASTARS